MTTNMANNFKSTPKDKFSIRYTPFPYHTLGLVKYIDVLKPTESVNYKTAVIFFYKNVSQKRFLKQSQTMLIL